MNTVVVEIVRTVSVPNGGLHNIGERVAFDDAIARDLIARGVAKRVAAPPVNKVVASAPAQKQVPRMKAR